MQTAWKTDAERPGAHVDAGATQEKNRGPAAASGCRLCGSLGARALFVKREVPHFLCGECGLISSRPAVNPNLRPLSEFDDAYLQYLDADPADDANHNALAKWLRRFAPLENARILDVGCGGGKWVRYLRKTGADAVGLEPSDALFQRFLCGEGCFFRAETADFLRGGRGPFDIITVLDVIEHVENPGDFLDDLSALLADGGIIALSTPDCGSPHARALGRRWHFYHKYHLSLFNRASLTRAAAARELRPLHFSRRGKLRSCGYVARYAFQNILNRPPPAWAARLDALHAPINLFDVMHLCFKKRGRQAGPAEK